VEKLTWVLWRERELLEALLYRLELEELVMATGRTRWLANAARDVDQAAAALRDAEVMRAVAADEAAEAAGLAPNSSLGDLIAARPGGAGQPGADRCRPASHAGHAARHRPGLRDVHGRRLGVPWRHA
jgi:hypothetical protein